MSIHSFINFRKGVSGFHNDNSNSPTQSSRRRPDKFVGSTDAISVCQLSKNSEIASSDIRRNRKDNQDVSFPVFASKCNERGDPGLSVYREVGDCRATPAFLQVRNTADRLAMTVSKIQGKNKSPERCDPVRASYHMNL